MSLSQTPPARNVKIRRVRGLAAFGVAVAVVVFVLLLAVSQPAAGADAGGAYQYAKAHATLYGKMAALSHYDVLKTTEPLTCSDGVQNFTCLLSKTDITPVLRELKKIGAAPEASPTARSWVLVLDFNFTEGSWRWRNITVVKGWELKWNNETAYVFQAQLKRSLGELLKTKDRLTRPFFVEMRGITFVAVKLDRLVVATSNATETLDGRRIVDPRAVERVKKIVQAVDPYADLEVVYSPPAMPIQVPDRNRYFNPVPGGVAISIEYDNGTAINTVGCTLGYTGLLYGQVPVVVTAWHCTGWVWGRSAVVYQPNNSFPAIASAQNPLGCSYWWEGNILVTTCDIVAISTTNSRLFSPRVYRPSSYANWGVVSGVMGRYDNIFCGAWCIQLPLHKAGISSDITSGVVISYNVDVFYSYSRRLVAVKDMVATNICVQPGDSGSPVYYIPPADSPYCQSGICNIYAYGIVSGCAPFDDNTQRCICSDRNYRGSISPLDAYHLYIKYT